MELPIRKRLREELESLRYELTVQVPKALQEAAAQGDLSENAEYESARARQDFLRARVGNSKSGCGKSPCTISPIFRAIWSRMGVGSNLQI